MALRAASSLSDIHETSALDAHSFGLPRAEKWVASDQAVHEGIAPESHGHWTPAPDRPHPVDILEAEAPLVEEGGSSWRSALAESPLAFFERTAAIMAFDLAVTPTSGVKVQLCGDCHAANFRSYSSAGGTKLFDISDFDQTLPGPWEWDVKRLATSLIMIGRHNGVNPAHAREAARTAVHAYGWHMIEYAAMRSLDVWNSVVATPQPVASPFGQKIPRRYRRRSQEHELRKLITQVQIVDGERRIVESLPVVTRLASPVLEEWSHRAFRAYQESIGDAQRYLLEQYRLVDTVRLTMSVGSRPAERFIWLLEGKNLLDTMFLQVTEARPSVLEPHLGRSRYTNSAERIVAGQQQIQGNLDPFLGWLRSDDGVGYYVRDAHALQRIPEVMNLGASELHRYADVCGWALARSHARSGDRIQIAAQLGDGERFAQAVAQFADTYANQVERDYGAVAAYSHRPKRATRARRSGATLAIAAD